MAKNEKQAALEVIEALPEDASLEEIMYGLYVRERIERGLKDIDEGKTVSHDEVRRSVTEWLRSPGQ